MKVFRLIIFLVLLTLSAFGQQVEQFVPDPNAVSLMTPVEIPASHYTGTPNISIPLYTVKLKDFSMPISIAYQASGIQVAQESSVIGLGWSLNAGGSISRVIRGYNDFMGKTIEGYSNWPDTVTQEVRYNISGFYDKPDVIKEENVTPDLFQRPTICGWTHFYLLFDGLEVGYGDQLILPHDMEPDIFTYSFCGYSGKFFINREGGFTFVDNNNLKVISASEGAFTIQDANGIKYNLTSGTKSRSFNQPFPARNSLFETVIDNPDGKYVTPEVDADVSSWNLDEIILPAGDTISFDYVINEPYKSHVRVSQSQVKNLPAAEALKMEDYLDTLLCYAGTNSDYNYSFQIYEGEKILKRISFGDHSVEFENDDRRDLKNFNDSPNQQKRITGFQVKSDDETIKTVSFYNNAYFNENTNETYKELYLRLKLDSVKINDMPVYAFKYNNDHQLPRKNSPSFDHWGYYNDERNKDRYGNDEIHAFFQTDGYIKIRHQDDPFNLLELVSFIMEGANRNADFSFAQTAILEEIRYPTGGSRKFYYGSNQFFDTDNLPILIDSTINALENGDIPSSNEINFSISTDQYIDLGGSVFIKEFGEGPDYTTSPYWYAKIVDAETQSNTYAILAYDGIEYNKNLTVHLEPGEYILKTQGDSYNGYGAQLSYYEQVYAPNFIKNGGGLRIEKIEESNGVTRQFDYTIPFFKEKRSSGKLLSSPEYVNVFYNGFCEECGGPDLDGSDVSWLNLIAAQRHSSTIRPLVGANGTSVGYSRVKEILISEDGDTSQTIYNFKNEPEKNRSYMLPNLPNVAVLSNGLVESVEYMKNSEIVRKEIFSYEKDTNRSYGHIACRQDIESYNMMFYKNTNQWWKLKNKETIDYYPTRNIKTTELFEYNIDNFQVNRHKTFNNEQRAIVNEIKFPNDYSPTIFESLINNNMVTRPIDSRTYKGSTLVSGSQTEYNTAGAPINIYNFEFDNEIPFSKNDPFTFNTTTNNSITNIIYNYSGRISKVFKKNDIITSYVWGYDNEYPVIKIESNSNIDINTIQSSVNALELSVGNTKTEIDDDIALLKSVIPELDGMVSLFTYKPLVGITSKTDLRGRTIYYIYDDYGRLKHVLNHDGNIIDELEYQYGSQNQ